MTRYTYNIFVPVIVSTNCIQIVSHCTITCTTRCDNHERYNDKARVHYLCTSYCLLYILDLYICIYRYIWETCIICPYIYILETCIQVLVSNTCIQVSIIRDSNILSIRVSNKSLILETCIQVLMTNTCIQVSDMRDLWETLILRILETLITETCMQILMTNTCIQVSNMYIYGHIIFILRVYKVLLVYNTCILVSSHCTITCTTRWDDGKKGYDDKVHVQ